MNSRDTVSDQKPIVGLVRKRLEDHPHFRGRTHLLRVEAIGSTVVVSGPVPTYYLKQLLQEAVRAIPNVANIDNRVDVTYS